MLIWKLKVPQKVIWLQDLGVQWIIIELVCKLVVDEVNGDLFSSKIYKIKLILLGDEQTWFILDIILLKNK